jgi:hypothetical protein
MYLYLFQFQCLFKGRRYYNGTCSILFGQLFYIYQKISNKLVGILHRARKNRYWLPYPFCLWSCSILSITRFQTSWLGSFIEHVRTGTVHVIHSVCEAVLYIYQKISNKLVGILHCAPKNRYWLPYSLCLWSVILSTRRFQTNWWGSFIARLRQGTAVEPRILSRHTEQ